MGLQKIDSIKLSKYILSKVGEMNQQKLQKLIYYTQSWHLAYFEQELIDDRFEAWLHGPISRNIWNYYKHISNVYDIIQTPNDKDAVVKELEVVLTDDQLDLVNSVLDEYGGSSAFELESLTHSESPWQKARIGCGIGDACEKEIDNMEMLDFYRTRLYGENFQTAEA